MTTYICGDSDCPFDDRFEHRFYFGCVPKTFSEATGRARGHGQRPVFGPWRTHLGVRWLWDGGCAVRKVTT